MNRDFLLHNQAAKTLYHEYAKKMPIIDFHCHLSPFEIATNRKFNNLTELWLEGDHYKMRAMRANGVDENFITGNASDFEKFVKWAETVPYTLMNPLYHWTHLELKRYFGIDTILNPSTAKEIYNEATSLLQTEEYRAKHLIKKMNVEIVCTTDDPIDDLKYHKQIVDQGYSVKVLPAWRPDKAMAAENPEEYNTYLDKLSKVSGIDISGYENLLKALKIRQTFFNSMGCKLSDHGIENFYTEKYTNKEINDIFNKIRTGNHPTELELLKFKSALFYQFAVMNHDFGWTQQFHVGAIRNNNTRMLKLIGTDKGYDSIGGFDIAKGMSIFLNRLELNEKLTKTIVYNINPSDNELMATMVGNFNDGLIPGKMQFGSAWWFNDQKDGMQAQVKALSNMGLLGRFVGMTTDSRSFLSYTRHEYFRRILCNLIGTDIENGELPADMKMLGEMIEGICYYNAKRYFEFG
ncbi:glucuronate isomerase [Confluentibacter flavum]|uniref:Uronate isomerase n=2 Tax=Confluentibacter flavum TaxID=1909700 RepID=A0A2N3HKC7_9FLAO|nr:glucuronate isomerase [Confluentibacter flavum]